MHDHIKRSSSGSLTPDGSGGFKSQQSAAADRAPPPYSHGLHEEIRAPTKREREKERGGERERHSQRQRERGGRKKEKGKEKSEKQVGERGLVA